MTNLDSMLKSRDITLWTKVHLVKAMVFPVVMYGCHSWTVKKAEHQRTDTFKLWCWRRLIRVPWTARRSNQSIVKEISPGISLEGMMLTLKLQYFGHLMRRVDSLEKTLMLGKIEGKRRRGQQRTRWLNSIWLSGCGFEQTLGNSEGQGSLVCCSPWVAKNWTRLSDRTIRLRWDLTGLGAGSSNLMTCALEGKGEGGLGLETQSHREKGMYNGGRGWSRCRLRTPGLARATSSWKRWGRSLS